MKRLTTLILAASVGCCITSFAPSTDGSFAGVIKYSIDFENGANQQMANAMKDATFTIYLTQGKSKSVLSFSMGTQTSISGMIPDTVIGLTDFSGHKYEMKIPISSNSNGGKDPVIEYLSDTKEIAGYTCHRAKITGATGSTTDVYYTDQLPSYEGKKGEYKGLKGFPLEFTSTDRGTTIKFSAISVTQQSLTDDIFSVPDGYTLQAMPAMGQQQGMRGNH